jgi:hypothetical protein
MDVATKARQTWSIKSTDLQPIDLSPTTGRDVVIGYLLRTTNMSPIDWPIYLASMPAVSGNIVWNGASFVGGGASVNLLTSNNKQNIVGVVTGQDVTNETVQVTITDSKPISGYMNVGQYFIGQNVTFNYRPPIYPGGSGLSGAVEVSGAILGKVALYNSSGFVYAYIPGWRCDNMRNKRTMPDSAYNFSANITYEKGVTSYSNYYGMLIVLTPTTKIKFNSVSGTVPSFRIIIAVSGSVIAQTQVGQIAIPMTVPVEQLAGPISNYTWNFPDSLAQTVYNLSPSALGWAPIQIWAHPDPNVGFSNMPDLDNWQLLITIPYIAVGM